MREQYEEVIHLMDAQDITLDSFWQELFYSHELCRLSGEKPDESAIQAYERSAKAIGGEPMQLLHGTPLQFGSAKIACSESLF